MITKRIQSPHQHDWHWYFTNFKKEVIHEHDRFGIPIICYICQITGMEWYTLNQRTILKFKPTQRAKIIKKNIRKFNKHLK